jgi:small-conductance mechanosensitive channel
MVVKSVEPAPNQSVDPLLYRLLVGGLVAVILLVVAFVFVLALYSKVIPEGLIAIGSAAVGGLVGLLVPSPAK